MTNLPFEPSPEGPRSSEPRAPGVARAPLVETLAYTCARDLCDDSPKTLSLARDLLKDVRKSGLKSSFAEALLRRLALAEWTRMDRPRPHRLESKDPKESAILLFFLNAWGATYEDLGVALTVSEDRARHLVHKARMEQIATITRIPGAHRTARDAGNEPCLNRRQRIWPRLTITLSSAPDLPAASWRIV